MINDSVPHQVLTGPTRDAAGEFNRFKPGHHPYRPRMTPGPDPTRRAPEPEVGRRSEPRFTPVVDGLWMQWWEDGAYLGQPGKLVNVSRHGALIVSPRLLQPGQSLRVYLDEAEPQVGVDSVVLGTLEGRNGSHQIRIGFRAGCPDSFFEAASHGFEYWLARHQPVY